jgi:hypothetical protein
MQRLGDARGDEIENRQGSDRVDHHEKRDEFPDERGNINGGHLRLS